MVYERGEDRLFLGELSLVAAAWYLVKKYLDGFLKGLGVEELGKKRGEAVARAIAAVERALKGAQKGDEAEMHATSAEAEELITELQAVMPAEPALEAARVTVTAVLTESGLPGGEARRITIRLESEIWRTSGEHAG
jgi:hypothetical protein